VLDERLPVVVLFYHRIADDRANAWTTSTRAFVRQIRWLRSHFEMISLEEVQRIVRRGANCRPCVSITFDDGYLDNCREAVPLLIKERIPCTYFVTVRNVLEGEPFAHDLLQGNRLPPNTIEQLKAMASAGIEIGAHTYTHADLRQVTDPEQLREEVITAGEHLQGELGHAVRYFAFPFGMHANLSSEAFELASQAGYEAACSAYGGFNFPGGDAFHLQRVGVGDSLVSMKNAATLDPRRLRVPRFEYQVPGTSDRVAPVGSAE
jgi:peptidoglycan/xylan/chitin deacetylase (PgdA/CDA1 family)